MRIGSAFVREDGSVVVNLDLLPKGIHVFQITADERASRTKGETVTHPIFGEITKVVEKITLLGRTLPESSVVLREFLQSVTLDLEGIVGYQDYLNDLDADEVEND
jgi:hypothetical protein